MYAINDSTPTAAAPITSLHHDILIHIFHLNTHTKESEFGHKTIENPSSSLDLTRYTSQVFHAWRHLILQSPTIWGSLIDMSVLNNSSDTWFDEIIRRTGMANLSIYGPVGRTPQSRLRFTALLVAHWHRIQRLDVDIYGFASFDRDLWDIFWARPAPNLEKFLVGRLRSDTLSSRGKGPLFAGSAPVLRRFHADRLYIDVHSPWLSNLCSLTLSCPFDTMDVLKILCRTIQLESLVIQATSPNTEAMNWTNQIHLPCLSYLHLASTINQSLIFLPSIIPQAGCALIIRAEVTLEDRTSDNSPLAQLIPQIAPYAKSYNDLYSPKTLALGLLVSFVELRFKTERGDGYFGRPNFRINLNTSHRDDSPNDRSLAIDAVFGILSPLSLHTVSTLRVLHFGSVVLRTAENSKFVELIQSLTGVKQLELDVHAFSTFNQIVLHPSLVLPQLEAVTVIPAGTGVPTTFPDELLLFLRRRRDGGVPLSVLNVRSYHQINASTDWGFLNEIQGLKLIYGGDDLPVERISGTEEQSEDL